MQTRIAVRALALALLTMLGTTTCRLGAAQTVYAWGDDHVGQLGIGRPLTRLVPQSVAGASAVKSVAGGSYHSVALRSDGSVVAWGGGSFGQLGDGVALTFGGDDRPYALPVVGVPPTVAVASRALQSLALAADGSVWQWGAAPVPAGSDWSLHGISTPQVVSGISDVVAIAAGGSEDLASLFQVAAKRDGTVWIWGVNNDGLIGGTQYLSAPAQMPGISGVVAVAAGRAHILALRSDGSVWSWGQNNQGQLGDGTNTTRQTPVPVPGLAGVTAIACAGDQSLALRSDGTIWAWGSNNTGQLGTGTYANNSVPTQVVGLSNVVSIATAGVSWGGGHSVALRADGSVWVWGKLLATGSATAAPSMVLGPGSAVAIGAGGDGGDGSFYAYRPSYFGFALAVRPDGAVVSWGDNGAGQLGDGFPLSQTLPVRREATGAIAATGARPLDNDYDLTLFADGTVSLTGYNEPVWWANVSSGVPFVEAASAPLRLTDIDRVSAIAAGRFHTLVLRTDGTVWAIGLNSEFGEAGSAPLFGRMAQVTGISDVVAIAAHEEISAALKRDGTVWAWGRNYEGEIGNGTTDSSSHPVPSEVRGLSNVVAIAAGFNRILAVRSDGTVWEWGGIVDATGTYVTQSTPAQVGGLSGVIAVSCSYYHDLALKADGTVWAWGDNSAGELGIGAPPPYDVYTPVQVSGLANVTAISAGYFFSAALDRNGTVWTWGADWRGQLGDGTTLTRYSPTAVSLPGPALAIAASADHMVAIVADGVAPDVSGAVRVTRGGFRLNRATGRFEQILTLTNTGRDLAGPISVTLDGLPATISLYDRTSITTQARPSLSPYIDAPVTGLPAGASVSLTLQFTNPTKAGITYTTRVLAGPGSR